jgi:DNA-binding CsgD family transcriptional regulator
MHPRLSARQEQCLRLTAFRTDKEIAAHLGISEATVKKHVHEACQRLGVNRRKAALALLDPIVPDPVAAGPAGTAADAPTADTKQPMATSGLDTRSLSVEDRGEGEGLAAAGSGPSAATDRPAAHLGYRAPPRSPTLRITLIVALTIILAACVATTVVMLGEMHEAVGKIDAKVYPGVAKKKP